MVRKKKDANSKEEFKEAFWVFDKIRMVPSLIKNL